MAKACLFCNGCGHVHVYPCWHSVTRPYDGVICNPPPCCNCKAPACTECAGTGNRTTRLFDTNPAVSVLMVLDYPCPDSKLFYLIINLAGNLWTICVTPVVDDCPAVREPFSALIQFAVLEAPCTLLVPGSRWGLFYPKHIGQMMVM